MEQNNGPWPGPKGLIPVTSGRSEDANLINRHYLDSILVEMRILDSVEPDLTTEIFGKEFASPIVMPAFSHLNKVGKNGRKPMRENAWAAKKTGMMNWIGMETDGTYKEISEVGVPTIRNIKPFSDHNIIYKQIEFSKQHDIFALGMDICHVPGKNGKYDIVDGIPLGPVTVADLKSYVQAAGDVHLLPKGFFQSRMPSRLKKPGLKELLFLITMVV